jgi:hypothetical protein
MRKLLPFLATAGVFFGSVSFASAFEAMLGGNFNLHARPGSRHHIMTLGAGEVVDIDHCKRSWCAVTHGPHAGYIYLTKMLDGHVYGPGAGAAGVAGGDPIDAGVGLVTAPVAAAGAVVTAGVSVLR